jgi:hypothetical protein
MKTQHWGWNVVLPLVLWHSAQLGRLAALYSQGNSLVLISVRGWVDPRGRWMRTKEYVTWKFPRTLPGIEPGTSRFVAHMNAINNWESWAVWDSSDIRCRYQLNFCGLTLRKLFPRVKTNTRFSFYDGAQAEKLRVFLRNIISELHVFIVSAWYYVGCFYLETFKWHAPTCSQASHPVTHFEILNNALRGKLPSNIFF